VHGVTTAATIWAAAAVGVAIAAEGYLLSIAASLITIVLLELRIVTKNIRPGPETREDNGRYEEPRE
jgi:uncharacterized membrane protein YhiD involved in acid resistance